METTCQLCQQPIASLKDTIYQLWEGKAESLCQPNHQACAREQEERNRRHAAGYVECIDCGTWVLDLTANRLGGYCRQCSARVDEFQDESANLY